MKKRSEALRKIDSKLLFKMDSEINYWKNVLTRIVAVVKALSSRGLSFRDDKEIPNNGNFMMALELISEYDPFIAQHIKQFGNQEKDQTSYLSFHTYEQFIVIMANQVTGQIIKEIKNARYYSIIVDSIPDVSHNDQLSLIIRYVSENGTPVERFICFLEKSGHKSEELADAVLTVINSFNINISFLRGLTYDNAINMSGAYKRLQVKIKEVNPLADYVPCSAHSLNLVGSCAASCCKNACCFFDLLQNIYAFFSSSTQRWEILSSSVKELSATRWSAREDTCMSLNKNWDEVINALTHFKNNQQNPQIRYEAIDILEKLKKFEIIFMVFFWGDILGKFNAITLKLQSNIDLTIVVELYESIILNINNLRNENMFEVFEDRASKLYGGINYKLDKRKRKIDCDEIKQDELHLSGRQHFLINTYYAILDNIYSELIERKEAYDILISKYSFFIQMTTISKSEVFKCAEQLRNIYKDDLDRSFCNECIHFQSFIKSLKDAVPRNIKDLYLMIRSKDLQSVYPYVDIALRMFLCTSAINCTSEQSFSTLRRIKTYLRSVMSNDHLNALAILNIESDLTKTVNYDNAIKEFAELQVKKNNIN